MKLNPALFQTIYTDLLNQKKTRTSVQNALDTVDDYMARRAPDLFRPVLEHLRDVGEARSSTEMPVEAGARFFESEPAVGKKIEVLRDLGLGYLTLGQSATTLSGGEAQRIKIATEFSKLQRSKHTVYILDEPTTGLHLAAVERLLDSLNRLVDAGHIVLLIEHHLDVIKTVDYVIDLSPEGGHAGGEVVVTGTPEEIAACPES
jgi:excinuclease UvrABC ATPase subunit